MSAAMHGGSEIEVESNIEKRTALLLPQRHIVYTKVMLSAATAYYCSCTSRSGWMVGSQSFTSASAHQ